MRRLSFVFLVLPLASCVTAVQMPPLSASHPASPAAEEAPVPAMSPTLALPERAIESRGATGPRESLRGDEATTPEGSQKSHGGGHAH
jgi:hypothetical protein